MEADKSGSSQYYGVISKDYVGVVFERSLIFPLPDNFFIEYYEFNKSGCGTGDLICNVSGTKTP
jgi:hypothetical protein